MFSIIDGVLLRPLPYQNAAQVIALDSRSLPSSASTCRLRAVLPEFADIRSRVDAYAQSRPPSSATAT